MQKYFIVQMYWKRHYVIVSVMNTLQVLADQEQHNF